MFQRSCRWCTSRPWDVKKNETWTVPVCIMHRDGLSIRYGFANNLFLPLLSKSVAREASSASGGKTLQKEGINSVRIYGWNECWHFIFFWFQDQTQRFNDFNPTTRVKGKHFALTLQVTRVSTWREFWDAMHWYFVFESLNHWYLTLSCRAGSWVMDPAAAHAQVLKTHFRQTQ